MTKVRKRHYAYIVECDKDYGWGSIPDALWGMKYLYPESRIFATAREARAVRNELRNAGCWTWEDPDTGETREEIPEFVVNKIAVYEACWLDTKRDADIIDKLIEIHGGDIEFAKMPKSVARWLMAKYGAASNTYYRASASLAGASSATHTAAFIAARYANRVHEIKRVVFGET